MVAIWPGMNLTVSECAVAATRLALSPEMHFDHERWYQDHQPLVNYPVLWYQRAHPDCTAKDKNHVPLGIILGCSEGVLSLLLSALAPMSDFPSQLPENKTHQPSAHPLFWSLNWLPVLTLPWYQLSLFPHWAQFQQGCLLLVPSVICKALGAKWGNLSLIRSNRELNVHRGRNNRPPPNTQLSFHLAPSTDSRTDCTVIYTTKESCWRCWKCPVFHWF